MCVHKHVYAHTCMYNGHKNMKKHAHGSRIQNSSKLKITDMPINMTVSALGCGSQNNAPLPKFHILIPGIYK